MSSVASKGQVERTRNQQADHPVLLAVSADDRSTHCPDYPDYPDDVIHGDGDNINVIPAHYAGGMADLCEAQDDLEAYLALRVQAGESLWGLYPPRVETRAAHKTWVAAGRPAIA